MLHVQPHHATDHRSSRAELSGAYSSCERDPRTIFQRATKEAMLQDAGAQKLPEQHLQRRLTASMVNQLQIMSASKRYLFGTHEPHQAAGFAGAGKRCLTDVTMMSSNVQSLATMHVIWLR